MSSYHKIASLLLISLSLLPLHVSAQEKNLTVSPSGGGRIDGGQRPYTTRYEVDAAMVYSPFKPYWKFPFNNVDAQHCWWAPDCLFEAAGESRKQQFAATALVMGLILLTLKDIAWPARRLVFVTKSLPWFAEILVLSLGLVPMRTGDKLLTERRSRRSGLLAKTAWNMGQANISYCIVASWVTLSLCFASLFVMEIYSKRSSLGCPAPVFIATWHVIALVPGVIHSLFAASRRRRQAHSPSSPRFRAAHNDPPRRATREALPSQRRRTPERGVHLDLNNEDEVDRHTEPTWKEREKGYTSAIQGANEAWVVQLAWSVYYIAGTLIFTSIMAVTVPELVIWVFLGLATAACSKISAFLVCLVYEDTGVRK